MILLFWIIPTIIIFGIKYYELKQIYCRPITRQDIFNIHDSLDVAACIPICNIFFLIIIIKTKWSGLF